MDLQQCEQLVRAIDVSDAPICFGDSNDLAINRAEWADDLLDNPEEVSGFNYFIDSVRTGLLRPLNGPKELLDIINSNHHS